MILEEVHKLEAFELELTKFNSKRALSEEVKQLEVLEVGNCKVLIDTKSPKSMYYNRVKGFSLEDKDQLHKILAIYEKENISPCFDMSPLHVNNEIANILTENGFMLSDQLVFLKWSQDQPYFSNYNQKALTISEITKDNVKELIQLIVNSNDLKLSDDVIHRQSHYFYQPNFKNYIAYVDNNPAALASIFIHQNKAYFANAYTFPEFRGKGCQHALLHHRLMVTKQLGISMVYSDVEFGSISHNNLRKFAFQQLYMNSFWIRKA
ncbi:hypothetical protein ACFSCX_16755 [Bacillus salitolerans]|uniref:N-acetyltransferase domain-containing protein n=1 Tax=Bacillus salitolerans TaxID=1437434 RepID=A0ABW4LSQ6_9BACI